MLVTVGNTRPEKQYNNTLWSISQWMNDCGAKVRLRDAILICRCSTRNQHLFKLFQFSGSYTMFTLIKYGSNTYGTVHLIALRRIVVKWKRYHCMGNMANQRNSSNFDTLGSLLFNRVTLELHCSILH